MLTVIAVELSDINAETPAVAVRLAVFDTNGDEHDVPIVPVVSVHIQRTGCYRLSTCRHYRRSIVVCQVIRSTSRYCQTAHPAHGAIVTFPLAVSFTYTFWLLADACIVNCAAFTSTELEDVPIDPASLTNTTIGAVLPLVPVIPVPPVAITPAVVDVPSRKNSSPVTVPTELLLTVIAVELSVINAETPAVAVKLAVFDTNGDEHDVPIVPVVSVTSNVPAVTVSPLAVTIDVALLSVRL